MAKKKAIQKQPAEKFLDEVVQDLNSKPKPPKILKTVPMQKKWNALHAEWSAVQDQITELQNKSASLHALLWATIEREVGIYDKAMVISKDDKLEIYDMKK